jgi:UTP--glucose-1-phosphate uridylyltransferase
MKVTTALIFASGFGSRMLPVTSAVQKELLPILNRPIIDYVVNDCLAAGITRIIFVIRPGSHALQDYYTGNPTLETHLERYGKHSALKTLRDVHAKATFEFVEQPASAGYGTAIPLRVALKYLPKDEAFLACDGDAFSWRTDGASETAALVQAFAETSAAGALMALERPEDQLSRYGVLRLKEREGREYLEAIVEKPKPGHAPSRLINVSKYILTPLLIPYITAVEPNADSGEYYLTDAMQAAAADHPIAIYRAQGKFLDTGNTAGWLEANLTVAQSHPDLLPLLHKLHQD